MAFNLASKLRMSLLWKFLIALSMVILLIIPGAAYLFITQSLGVMEAESLQKAKILKDNLRNKGIAMSRNIALNISSAVAGSDFSFLQNIISSSVASDKEIRFAIIQNRDGRALVHSDPLKAMQLLTGSQDLKSREVNDLTVSEYPLDQEDILEVDVPIQLGEERWGTLRLGYTLQFLNEEIRKSRERQRMEVSRLTNTASLIAVISILSAVLLAFLFSRHIVRAIRAIVRATERVAQGDFTQRVEIKTGDELETMGNAINIMTRDLENLNREVFQKARMESELQTAELVQKKIMPKKDPKLPRLELSSYFRSASETGGDWFAYSLPEEKDLLAVINADVTGHGLPAALITEAAQSCFQTISTLNKEMGPGEILRMLNQVLIPQMDQQFGMTAFVSKIRLDSMTMAYANAGHNMPLVRNGHSSTAHLGNFGVLSARGPRLGDSTTDRFEEKAIELKTGMLFFWYTDGLLDCVDDRQLPFGKKRLLEVLHDHGEESSTLIRDAIVDEMMRFTGGVRPPDDVTFIVGKIL